MNPTSKTIVFFGNERLATGLPTQAPALLALIHAGYKLAAVVVAQNQMSKSRRARPLEVAAVAEAYSIPLMIIDDLSDKTAVQQLADLQADVAVLAAYGKIVPQKVIDVFPAGIVNIHPSLLPQHRGSTPIESAILQNDRRTGMSLMQLVAKMDAGPVYAQQAIDLKGTESKLELVDALSALGAMMLVSHLPAIVSGALQPTAQDDLDATYDQRLDKATATLNFQKPADQLIREVRAYSGWPRSRCKIGTANVIVTKAHATSAAQDSGIGGNGPGVAGSLYLQPKELGIYTSDGIFIIDELIPSGKKTMSAQAFLAGFKFNLLT